jgi:protein gp37
MAENSKIEWCHHTFNPWRGCTKVSSACDICYAEALSFRNPGTLGVWGKYGTRVIASEAMWKEPIKWNKKATEAGEPHRVFCASLADVFEGPETMPEESWEPVSAARERLGELIDETPDLDWLLLTKRPQNVLKYGPLGYRWTMEGMPENVWLGTTVENQKYADERIPRLLKIPAAVRFLSVEPMLGPIDLRHYIALDETNGSAEFLEENGWGYDQWSGGFTGPNHFRDSVYAPEPGIHLVIAGGESGSRARPMHPDWPRSLRDQCVTADVPFFFKQWGEWYGGPSLGIKKGPYRICRGGIVEGHEFETYPDHFLSFGLDSMVQRVGKKAAGRDLDGREWNEMPEVSR